VADKMELIQLFKNLAILGELLLVAYQYTSRSGAAHRGQELRTQAGSMRRAHTTIDIFLKISKCLNRRTEDTL
jgi:hypothetical protein